MRTDKEILQLAKATLTAEADGILGLIPHLGKDFVATVQHILQIQGRVILTGVGKSAIVAQKIVATFNSTGTPSIFMHAADALHGDLGIIQNNDLVMCISKSGNTPEIKALIPLLKTKQNSLVAMVGNVNSYLAQQADTVLNTHVHLEACPLNLAPTTSTTAQLAMGDALAICLLQCRGFTQEAFAKFHPGGTLGKRLYLRVGDLSDTNQKPQIHPSAPVKEVICEITKNRLGAVAVTENNTVLGIITDGDIRRMMEKHDSIIGLKAQDIMNRYPKAIHRHELAVHALELMRKNNITQLLVLENKKYVGVIHLHDLLKEGIL